MVADLFTVWKDYLILAFAATGIAVLVLVVVKVINSYLNKNPMFGAKKLQALEEAKKQDSENEEANRISKEQAEAKNQADRAERLAEIEEELADLRNELEGSTIIMNQHRDFVKKSDVLGEDEKSLQTIQMLIWFIESRRADSIKEALHEYDKAMVNEQLLKLQEQRNALELKKIENERIDREQKLKMERQHQKEMEYIARENARGMDEVARRMDSLSQQVYFSNRAAADAAKSAANKVANSVDRLYYNNY